MHSRLALRAASASSQLPCQQEDNPSAFRSLATKSRKGQKLRDCFSSLQRNYGRVKVDEIETCCVSRRERDAMNRVRLILISIYTPSTGSRCSPERNINCSFNSFIRLRSYSLITVVIYNYYSFKNLCYSDSTKIHFPFFVEDSKKFYLKKDNPK